MLSLHKILTRLAGSLLLIWLYTPCYGQADAQTKSGLLQNQCVFEPGADVSLLRDEAVIGVNNDFGLRLERQMTFKFYGERKLDKKLSDIIFYPCPLYEKYYRLNFTIIEMDPFTKALLPKDMTSKVTSIHAENSGLRIKKGALLQVTYSVNFAYDEKVPDWRFQTSIPTELSSVRLQVPEAMKLKESVEGPYEPELSNVTEDTKSVRLVNQSSSMKISERFYQFSQIPSFKPEPFSDNSPAQLARLHMAVLAITKNGVVIDDFAENKVNKLVETLSAKIDFMGRIMQSFELKTDYVNRIKSITDKEVRLARIYDLVRRQLTWNRVDTISAPRMLQKVWTEKKASSTEINLVLVKILEMYGYDVAPLIVSTRNNGQIDTNNFALSDFNRTVAHVRMGDRVVILDATAKYAEYPILSEAVLNTTGLLISVDKDRWVHITDTTGIYKNNVTLLGHLLGDTAFLTNVYVNSYAYAKAERVQKIEMDSLKSLRDEFFGRGNTKIQLKHFIVANEYVDTLPLAQEFDIRVHLEDNNNLYGMVPTWFAVPDTLFTISENRKSDINFGTKQLYTLVSEYAFPENYEVYLVPNNMEMSSPDGSMHFEREFHKGTTNFSLRQTLSIDKAVFRGNEAMEAGKFLSKVRNMLRQKVMLKKTY